MRLTPRHGLAGAAVALLIADSLRTVLMLTAYPIVLHMAPPCIHAYERRLPPGQGVLRRISTSAPVMTFLPTFRHPHLRIFAIEPRAQCERSHRAVTGSCVGKGERRSTGAPGPA